MQSVVSYPDRGDGGDARYRGNFSPRLLEDLFRQFSPASVVDPMAGSGTTTDVCARMGIACWTGDLRTGFDILSDEIPVGAEMGVLHPPYYNMILYSGKVWGDAPDPRDLSRAPDYDTFLRRLNEAQYRLYESLRTGGLMAVLVGDLKRRGKLYPIQRDMHWIGEPVNLVVKIQHNMASNRVDYSGRFIPIVHEYLVITRKPEAWYVAIRATNRNRYDMRRYAKSPWRSVVQAGLEAMGGRASLPALYETLKDHARVMASKAQGTDWKAQIRRALQVYDDFQNVARGEWKLAWA